MNINLQKIFLNILFIISALILFNSCNICTNSESPEVTFNDVNFENVIREILEKYDDKITEDDMLGITTLSIGYREIENISGIEHCKNIQILDLEHNNINDISMLSELYELWYLRLRNNNIRDIGSISQLVNLKELIVNDNQVQDITIVSRLHKLIKLDLHNNQISNILPIVHNSQFNNGDTVELRNNPLSTTSIYSHIPRLENRGVVVHYTKTVPSDRIE